MKDKDGGIYPVCKVSLGRLGDNSPGIMLYLMFLKWMAVGFGIMSILSLPPLICNIVGGGIS